MSSSGEPSGSPRFSVVIGASEQELVIKHPEQTKKLEGAPYFHTRKSRWNEWRREGAAELPLLDPEGLRELAGRGIEVGSHCMTHQRKMPKIPEGEFEGELRGSAEALEGLGLPRPRALAYPHVEWSQPVAAAAFGAGYELAFSVEPGVADRAGNRFALPRIEVLGSDSPLTLRVKLRTAEWPRHLRERLLHRLGTRR